MVPRGAQAGSTQWCPPRTCFAGVLRASRMRHYPKHRRPSPAGGFNWEHLLCTACGAGYSLSSIPEAFEELVPTCPRCHGQLRPDIVMYGEALDEEVISGAVQAIAHADLLIVAGTSLVVYPAAGLLNYFSGSHLVLMNATPTSADADADLIIRDPVAHSFEQIMNELK